ncbi:excitatory amino acid transporter 5 isoform X3 [Tamandua tetradactyla]|uniref:excitatory amino acid transporter 5 isoform X3 n=1 Tax=Tamandua tetradactyla TaxID=48850 RepID=UPI00405467A9
MRETPPMELRGKDCFPEMGRFMANAPSLVSGLASLDAKTSSRLGVLTVAYYLWTTFMAVIVGIVLVSVIHPGGAAQKEVTEQSGKPIMSSADALLDLIRNMFPANLVEATFKQYRTKTTPMVKATREAARETPPRSILIYGVQEENGSRVQNFALDLTPPPEVVYKSEPSTSDGMNVLGIVIFSATMGIMLGRMGDGGAPLVSFCQCLNESVMKIVAVAVWYFPFGIVFLIAGKILEMDDPTAVGKKLGLYAVTVVCGLVVHGLFILPLLYFFITKKNPIVFIRGVLQALLIALATSSSHPTPAGSRSTSGRIQKEQDAIEEKPQRPWPENLHPGQRPRGGEEGEGEGERQSRKQLPAPFLGPRLPELAWQEPQALGPAHLGLIRLWQVELGSQAVACTERKNARSMPPWVRAGTATRSPNNKQSHR